MHRVTYLVKLISGNEKAAGVSTSGFYGNATEVIRDAIRREMKRGGQVYFLHNRVGDIESVKAKIMQLVRYGYDGISISAQAGNPLKITKPEDLAGRAVSVELGGAPERRARELSKNLRCLVCRNESIDESHADLARDLLDQILNPSKEINEQFAPMVITKNDGGVIGS